ncbi:polyprenyl synthetase family protein [Peribacillus acanthi]|uniref:polyprenyl synthetase family protein n=1 Tax=Peribacillus acanthi TaxID=2171554 RepID=UPI000D3ED385|nr:farnesyl diphosphate synthase [Peribacillus acanthi]
MVFSSFSNFANHCKKTVDQELLNFVNELSIPKTLKEAMIYSLEAGGKRIRPLLLFAVLASFQKDLKLGIPAACAIEMIHTYSLIHDDLPSMDNDDLRRGKPTNHIVFGEAMAILAGDALLTQSFEILSKNDSALTSEIQIKLIQLISNSAGASGMVGGQVADMEGENKQLTLEELRYIHKHKTGQLLVASVMAGAILAGASDVQVYHLKRFAEHVGLAFQIKDDILDIEGLEELIGKKVGSDIANQKSTYPSLLGLEGAKEMLVSEVLSAKDHITNTGLNAPLLHSLVDLIAERDH